MFFNAEEFLSSRFRALEVVAKALAPMLQRGRMGARAFTTPPE